MKINSYMRFTRQDIKGILSLLTIILILLAGPVLLKLLMSGGPVSLDYADIKQAGMPDQAAVPGNAVVLKAGRITPKSVLTPFDPNSAPAEVWNQTGLAPYKVRMIMNYLKKGGHFYRAEDIVKIYSLDSADCKVLLPMMKLETSREGYPVSSPFRKFRYQRYGSAWASEKLPAFRGKMSLNAASYETFGKLGISSQNIRMIMRYRERNGNFTDLRELKNLGLLDPQTYNRVRPFLTL